MDFFGINMFSGGGSGVAGAVSSTVLVIKVLLLAGIIGFIVYVIFDQKQFKIKGFFCKVLSDGRKLYFADSAKIIKKKDGVIKWKFRRLKKSYDPAPEDVQELTTKGKILVQGYVTKELNIVWRKDDTNYKALENSGFKPVSNDDRRAHAYEMEQARRHMENFLTKYGPTMIAGFTFVLILAVFMMFFGKVVQPTLDAQKAVNAGKQLDLQIIQELKTLQEDIQVITAEEKNANKELDQEQAFVIGQKNSDGGSK